MGDLCFSLTGPRWEEADRVVKARLGVRVVGLFFRQSGIQKTFSSRRQEGNSSCQ